MNVQKMEAHVTKTRSVLIMMDHTLVSVRTDLQEMEQFVWVKRNLEIKLPFLACSCFCFCLFNGIHLAYAALYP